MDLKLWWFLATFQKFSNTCGSLLRILCQKSRENQKKSHHFKTVSDFLIFVPQVKTKKSFYLWPTGKCLTAPSRRTDLIN